MLYTNAGQSITGYQMNGPLNGLERCPHCSIAAPNLQLVWSSQGKSGRTDGGVPRYWGAFRCQSCGSVVTAQGDESVRDRHVVIEVKDLFPKAKTAHEDIPETARTYLQQAMATLHAPDASAVMAGSAVDAMLKHLGLVEGSLYNRIDQALEKNILTRGMADWAHEVRLGSNRPRHADKETPHVSPEEAKQSVEFAEALGSFLFVLTAKIERGIKAAQAAE